MIYNQLKSKNSTNPSPAVMEPVRDALVSLIRKLQEKYGPDVKVFDSIDLNGLSQKSRTKFEKKYGKKGFVRISNEFADYPVMALEGLLYETPFADVRSGFNAAYEQLGFQFYLDGFDDPDWMHPWNPSEDGYEKTVIVLDNPDCPTWLDIMEREFLLGHLHNAIYAVWSDVWDLETVPKSTTRKSVLSDPWLIDYVSKRGNALCMMLPNDKFHQDGQDFIVKIDHGTIEISSTEFTFSKTRNENMREYPEAFFDYQPVVMKIRDSRSWTRFSWDTKKNLIIEKLGLGGYVKRIVTKNNYIINFDDGVYTVVYPSVYGKLLRKVVLNG